MSTGLHKYNPCPCTMAAEKPSKILSGIDGKVNSFLQYCFLDTLIKYGLFNPELKAMPMVSSPNDECKTVRKRTKPIIFTELRCAVGTSEWRNML